MSNKTKGLLSKAGKLFNKNSTMGTIAHVGTGMVAGRAMNAYNRNRAMKKQGIQKGTQEAADFKKDYNAKHRFKSTVMGGAAGGAVLGLRRSVPGIKKFGGNVKDLGSRFKNNPQAAKRFVGGKLKSANPFKNKPMSTTQTPA